MKKLVTGLILGLCCWAAATVSHAETKYALCVGINKYTLSGCNTLAGCVNDSAYFYTNLVERGGWLPVNMTKLNDSKATKANIRAAISNFAAKAVAGDTFVYQHSSHGDRNLLCTYNAEYKEAELAADLRSFASGVKVVIIVDACYSGSLFKDRAARKAYLASWDFAGEVSREMDAQQAVAVARGEKGADKALTSSEIGWVTAASDSETSIDFGYYDTDKWLTDPDYESGSAISGTFLGSATWGWWSGSADTSSVGDKDDYCDPLEFWKIGYDFCSKLDEFWGESDYSYTPQHTNDTVLRSVELGWVGDEEPGGVRFAPIPEQSAIVGTPLSYTLVATNSDGTAGSIAYSIASATAPAGSYSLNGNKFTFTPTTDGSFSFSFTATNATAKTGGRGAMTVNAALASPDGLANSGITDSSFTASWDAVPGAVSYFLEVFAADEALTSSKAADGAFQLVTSASDLTEGEYVIVAENADVAMNNTCSGSSSGYLGCTDVAVDGSSVSTDDASVIWTLAGDASSCTLFNAAAGMYVNPATTKSIGWAAEASGAWTLSLDGGLVTAANEKDASWVLQYNSSSPRFMCYSSKQKLLRFFRRDGASGALFSGDVGNVTSYTVEGLIPGDYTWRVRAVGNAKGPWSESQDVTLFADPSAPPSIRAIADIEIDVGETAIATVVVSAPDKAPVTSLSITDGDPAATLEDGVFSFAPATPGTYDFTITAVNANGPATVSFAVVASLADPETPEQPAVIGSDSFTAEWEAVPGATSYELDVVQGATSGGGGSGGTGEAILMEDFSKVAISNSNVIVDFDAVTQTAGWSGDTVYPAKGLVRVGKSGGGGYIQTPALSVSGSVTVEWSAFSWPNDATSVSVGVSVDGGANFTETSVDLTESMAAYTTTFPVSGASAIVRWQSPAGKKRFYLDDISISSGAKARDLDGNHVEGFPKNVGNVTSYEVTGLQPSTEYTFAFRAIAGDETTDWSEPVAVKTTEGPAAPAWSAIPAQTASIGYEFSIDLAAYVTGSPTPTFSLTAGDATLSGTVLSFTPAAGGEYAFTVTASNASGPDAETTFTVSAVDHVPTKYAVCVGINEYADINGLAGCVNDSIYMERNLVERGGWAAENVVRLNDAKATKAAIRKAIADIAAKAQAGDTFVYQHSSHGGQFNATEDDEDPLTGEEGKATFLCVYDEDYYDNTTAYNDYEIAADMAAFPAGVKVAVIVDACHSGGLFKSKEAARAAARSFDLAGRVTAIMEADRAARKARGENVAKALAPSEIGWATAAEYYEYSYDGGFYHTDEWLTDVMYGEEYYNESTEEYNYPSSFKQGGVFLTSATWGWWNGTADTDADGFVDVHEFWQKGYDFCSVIGDFWYEDSSYNYFPQCTNVAVLKSVELGWIEDPRPAAPANPAASAVTASSFTASWDAVENAVSYNLFVQKNADKSKAADADTLLSEDFTGFTSAANTDISDSLDDFTAVAGWTGDKVYSENGRAKLGSSKASGWLATPAIDLPAGAVVSAVVAQYSSDTGTVSIDLSTDGGSTWTALCDPISPTTSGETCTATVPDDCDGAMIRFISSSKRFYLDDVLVTGKPGTWVDVEGFAPKSVAGTSQVVDGLDMGSEYRFWVTAIDGEGRESDASARVSLTTAEEDHAPVWSDIPEQSAVAGEMFEFDVARFVKASPVATITLVSSSADAADYEFEDGLLLFTPPAEGPYSFEFQAANTIGTSNATLTVSVSAAPVVVPTLALSNPSSQGFDASWNACTGVSSYTLQIALDDQFTTGGGGDGAVVTETFANAVFSTTGSSYTDQTITGCDLGTWTATSCRGDGTGPIVRYAGTLTSPSLAGGVAAVEFDYEWPYKESGTCDIDLYVNDSKVGSATVTGGESGTASYTGFTAVGGPATIEFRNTGTSNKRMMVTQVRITSASKSVAKDGEGSLVKELTVEGTSTTVTGLDPDTLYYARVKGASDWSEVQSITTQPDTPAAPVWLDIEPQTATVGLEFGIDLSTYVIGSPRPEITVDGEPTDGGAWVRTFDEAGTCTFTLVAENSEGTATATLSVVVSEAPAAKYALCVGLSEYDMAAFAEMGLEVTPLKGCVNDAMYLKKNLTERGGWADGNVSLLTNGSATKSAIRGAIAAAAAKAKAGDTFVYEHSSHGLQGDEEDDFDVALATYDSLYEDAELAEDLASFADGVKVVVLVDACHSGGLFGGDPEAGTDGKARSAASFDIAARVSALIDANRAARKARSEDVSRTLAADQIGWVTAASYEETSKDAGYYDTDAWMSDDEAEGEERGGAFLAALAWGWWSGKADVSGEGDGDGWFDAYEGWSFSTPVCAEYDQTPQYLNEDVLRAVELGWVGDDAPSDAILFDPVPGAEVAIGEEATLAVVAKNADGTTDGITLSIVATDPEDLEYTFVDGTLAFTPAEDGIFLFTVQAVKGRLSTTKILGVTAVLPAPVAQEATDIAEDGFTANWLGVDAARNYQLQVSTDPDFPMGEPEKLVEEGFDEVTNTVSSLPEGWEFTGTFGTYATGGEAAPSIKLSTDKAVLTTPSFELNGGENGLAFWTKGNPGSGNVLTSTLTVQQLVGDEWKELAAPFVPSKDGETKEIEGLDPDSTRIRFVMAKTSGNIAIDDVIVAQAKGGPVVDDDEIPAGTTSYAVEDLEPGTTYYYRVRAIANTKSAWSEVIEVATAGEKPIPVPDLTVMAPETSADTSLAAFWVCTGAAQFRLQVATDEAFASLVFDETMTEIAKTVTGLTPETTYYVRVCALDGERVGDWSNVESITTAASGGDVPVQADIEAVTIDGTARTMKFAVPADAMVMTTTNLVTGPWVAYEGDVDGEGNVVIPLTGTAAFFRLGEPPAGD